MRKTITSFHKGHKAEERACAFLQKQGFILLARRFKTRYGEIDLIMQRPCDPNPPFVDPVSPLLSAKASLHLANPSHLEPTPKTSLPSVHPPFPLKRPLSPISCTSPRTHPDTDTPAFDPRTYEQNRAPYDVAGSGTDTPCSTDHPLYTLHFIEVKHRPTSIQAYASVTQAQCQRIGNAGLIFMQQHAECPWTSFQIDRVAIGSDGSLCYTPHIFTLPEDSWSA
jgi:Holliday junction resolvase-like predicted endonuclease